jgi:pyruvate kinase
MLHCWGLAQLHVVLSSCCEIEQCVGMLPSMHAEETKIGISYGKLCQSVKPGNIVLIADGAISIEVVEILNEKELRGEAQPR